MLSQSAKPRPRRLVLPALTEGQQVLFTFADAFPKNERKQEAERVLAARRRGKTTTVVVPDGIHIHVRQSADLPWHPIEPMRGRGQPPKVPTGTWEDHPELSKRIDDILDDAGDRADRGTEIREALYHAARDFLGAELFMEHERDVKSLARRAAARKGIASDEIERQFLVWRYGLTDPAVRKSKLLRKPRAVAHDFSTLVLKYGPEQPLLDADGKPARDENGRPILVRPPVCDEKGQPILWAPDEQGKPIRPYVDGEPLPRRRLKTVRPRVAMIFR